MDQAVLLQESVVNKKLNIAEIERIAEELKEEELKEQAWIERQKQAQVS